MKIKLSKSQWENMGKTAGWMKKAQLATPSGAPQPATNNQIGTQRVQPQQQQQPQQGQPATPTLTWLSSSLDKVLNSGAIQKEMAALIDGGGSAQTTINSINGQLQMLMQQISKAGEGSA